MVKKNKSNKNRKVRKPSKGGKSKKKNHVKVNVKVNVITQEEQLAIKQFCDNRIDLRVSLLKEIHALIGTRDELQKNLEELMVPIDAPERKELSDKLDRVKVQHGLTEKRLEGTSESFYETAAFKKVVEQLTQLGGERTTLMEQLESSEEKTPLEARLKQIETESKQLQDVLGNIINKIIKEQSGYDAKNAERLSDEKYHEMVATLTDLAGQMWADVKKKVKEDPAFMDISDKDKLKYFREDLDYDEFMNEYPVMTRYMVCMGQYSSKAFKRFLDKVRRVKHPEKCEKGYKEDQWVRRQADYVQYLWEAYQKSHINSSERKMVWQDAYKNLKGEFDDFRDKYKAVEEATKEEKKVLKASNTRDLLKRLAGGEQTLSEEETIKLISQLEEKVCKSAFRKVMTQLKDSAKYIEAVCSGKGTGPDEEDPAGKPRIIMTEHVKDESMDTIPEALVQGIDAEDMSKHAPIGEDMPALEPVE